MDHDGSNNDGSNNEGNDDIELHIIYRIIHMNISNMQQSILAKWNNLSPT